MTMPRKGRLVQTIVTPQTVRKLTHLAKATGHTKASYLRHLIELHLQAMYPSGATPAEVAQLARTLFSSNHEVAT